MYHGNSSQSHTELCSWFQENKAITVKKMFKTLYQTTKFRPTQIESIRRQQNERNKKKKNEIDFEKGRKHCGKWRKCWLKSFSPFPTMFSKAFFLRIVKSGDSAVRG